MSISPYDDIVIVTRRCEALRTAFAVAPEAVKVTPSERYMFMCKASLEKPNKVFLDFSRGIIGGLLDLRRSYLSLSAFLPILLVLPYCPWLEHIDLSDQQLTATLIELLCEAIRCLPCIQTINVSRNPFGSFGVRALLRVVQQNRAIVECRVECIQSVGSLMRRLEEACERNRFASVKVKREKHEECASPPSNTYAANY